MRKHTLTQLLNMLPIGGNILGAAPTYSTYNTDDLAALAISEGRQTLHMGKSNMHLFPPVY